MPDARARFAAIQEKITEILASVAEVDGPIPSIDIVAAVRAVQPLLTEARQVFAGFRSEMDPDAAAAIDAGLEINQGLVTAALYQHGPLGDAKPDALPPTIGPGGRRPN